MTPPVPAGGVAAGLAGERTELALTRTGLAVAACVAVVLRHTWPIRGAGQALTLGIVAAAAVVWAVAVLVLSSARRRRSPALAGDGGRPFGLMTLGTLVLAGGGVLLAFVAPG